MWKIAFEKSPELWYNDTIESNRRDFMKRVQAACICQTLHFLLKEDIPHETAARQVADEAANYKA